jgi:hypothetical protein
MLYHPTALTVIAIIVVSCGPAKPDELPLRQRFLLLDDLRGSATVFEEVEKQGKDLLDQYKMPDDRARIHYQMAHVLAQSDIRAYAKYVAKYAALGLEAERDPVQRGTLYSYLGDAAIVDPTYPTFAKRRRRAAKQWLEGYKELVALKLPALAPELPGVQKGSDDPDPVRRAEESKRHAIEATRRQEAERLRELVARRDVFIRQIIENYQREPEANKELEKLAVRVLKDRQMVDALLERLIKK